MTLRVLFSEPVDQPTVYALVDLREPERVRYVGQTALPLMRHRAHCFGGQSGVGRWVLALRAAGHFPAMCLLEECPRKDLLAREKFWIRHYRDLGQADLNERVAPVGRRVRTTVREVLLSHLDQAA